MSKQFSCEQCSYTTNRLYNLQRHIAKRHELVQSIDNNILRNNTDLVISTNEKVILTNEEVSREEEKVIPIIKEVILREEKVSNPFKCDSCYKTFKHKQSLKLHASTCKGTSSPFQCVKCRKILSSKQSKYKHMKICKGVQQTTETSQPIQHEATPAVQNQNNNYMINNGNCTINNNYTINIRNFGDENMEHITDEVKDRFAKQLNGKGILNLIKDVHFNPKVPENHNIRKCEDDKQLCKVYENGYWELKDHKSTINELIDKNKSIISRRIMEPEFEQSLNDRAAFNLIWMNYAHFDRNTVPGYFHECARQIHAEWKNFEAKYGAQFPLPQIAPAAMP